MTDDQGDPRRTESLVSVVVPTYGRDTIQFQDAIESVRDQTYGHIELVVVDDSSDDISSWLDSHDDWFTAVKRIRDRDHDGAAAARNTGIWNTRGEFIAFLDDDDRWHPEKIERQVATFRSAGEETGVVYTALEYVREGEVLRRASATTSGDVTKRILMGTSLGTFSTLMIRSCLLPVAGFIDDRFPVLEDREWCLRLSKHCQFEAIDDQLVRYRQGDHEQLTDDFRALRDVAVPLFEQKHRPLAAAYGPACERAFLASLYQTCVTSGLSSGLYGEARRFALRSLAYDPTNRQTWMTLVAALGGKYTYYPLRRARRTVHHLANQFTSD
ncbi:glycosyltransferase family 2 protein [Halorientalis marina]|uniref:glycosyltransferase family 2 protein n=1 Tax=Halorientalis marina TaxID=2931976 RepID=UPI001FF641D8|nr:glycosyltransferase family 2 protein [Halorientalis marina]